MIAPHVPVGPENVMRTFAAAFGEAEDGVGVRPLKLPIWPPRVRTAILHQRNRSGEGTGVGRVLCLPAADPHHPHVDDERAEGDQRQQRESDMDDDRAAVISES